MTSCHKIVLLHGTFGQASDWAKVITRLETYQIQAFALDLPGHNRLLPLAEESFAGYQKWLLEKVRLISDQPLAVAGYSLGGRLALSTSMIAPLKFSKVVLISAHPGLAAHERQARKMVESKTLALLDTSNPQVFFESWYSQPMFDDLRHSPNYDSFLKQRGQNDLKQVQRVMESLALSKQEDYLEALKKFPLKYLYLSGALDKKYSALGEDYSRMGVKHEIISDVGHDPLLEASCQLAEKMADFLASR